MSFPLLSENLIGVLWTAASSSLAGALMLTLAIQGTAVYRMPRVWVGVVSLMVAATYWADLYFYTQDQVSIVTAQLRTGVVWIFWPALIVLTLTGIKEARRVRRSWREAVETFGGEQR